MPSATLTLSSIPPVDSSSSSPSSSSAERFLPQANRNTRGAEWTNWANTNKCRPAYFHTPRSVDDIQSILSFARSSVPRLPVRVVGYGHSPGTIALTDGHMIAIGVHFNRVLKIDKASKRATVESGISLSSLNSALDEVGLALPMLGSISDQTLGGALACGTHGTNARGTSVIAACVVELELIDASGRVWVCNKDENRDLFNAARISLGALGVITKVTIQCEAAYDLIETTTTVPFNDWVNPSHFSSMLDHPDADFVRFHWIPHTETVVYTRMKKVYNAHGARHSVMKEQRAAANPIFKHIDRMRETKDRFIGFHLLQAFYYFSTFPFMNKMLVPKIANLYSRLLYPPMSPASSSLSSSPSSSSSSALVRQDRHDRILNFDCLFKQYVTEWSIDQRYTTDALKALRTYIESSHLFVHFPIEVRFGGDDTGDEIWLSPCYGRKQSWIGIIIYRPYGKEVEFEEYFKGFEQLMKGFNINQSTNSFSNSPSPSSSSPLDDPSIRPFDGKPHWAKNVCIPLASIDFCRLYPRFNDFMALRHQLDPSGMFENSFIRQLQIATNTLPISKDGANCSSQPLLQSKL